MHYEEIKKIIHSLTSAKVLVAGDLILDKYVWGKVSRISPEAPIQIFEMENEEVRLGGAGNVVQNLSAFGAQVSCLGVVGQDEEGICIQKLLQKFSVDLRGLFFSSDRPTTIKSRLIAQNQQVIRVDKESKKQIPSFLQKEIASFLQKTFQEFDLIVISDYAKGLLTDEVLSDLFLRAKEKNIPTLVDPKGKDYFRYKGATAITPNRYEAERATNIDYTGDKSLQEMSSWMISNLDLEAAIITLGSQGIFFKHKNGYSNTFPAVAKSVYDVTGAGDTVIAALAICAASGIEYERSVQFANCAAALVVEKLGAVTVSLSEILERSLDGKIEKNKNSFQNEEKALGSVEKARTLGKKIVFTNGCFDLIHQGHLEYLSYAKNLGDFLVVGLNSDASVRQIKGENRPFLPQETRASILNALEMVDCVILFDEPTPISLVKKVRPHILVKGEDYKNKLVVGREVVESYGGKVILAPLVKGCSTTHLAEKISQQFAQEEKTNRWGWEIKVEKIPEQ